MLVKPGDKPPAVSDWKEAVTSLCNIADEGFMINFGGGEPFLLGEILEIVRFAADKGFRTNIATNAYLIDEDMAKAIAASGLSTINISLDSVNEPTHDYLRGTDGVHKRAMKAIEYLDRYCPGLKKGICCVISSVNLGGILDLTEYVQRDNRLEWIYFMAVMQPNNVKHDPDWHRNEFSYLWPDDTEKAALLIGRLIELKNKGYKIVNRVPQLKAFRSYFADPRRFVKISQCNLSRALHVSSVGDVFICFQWGKLGNIKSDRLDILWNANRAETIRKDIAGCRRNCHFLINCFFEDELPFSF